MTKKIYLVGGALRDKLMGLEIKDRDFVAVGYEPSDFTHLTQVGKDFPVFLQDDGSELALARREKKVASGYSGFETETKDVSLEEDLKRRDLTINSIAYDEEEDRLIDPYKGVEDIEKKVLRHTSEAFVEDPLRVLRLARFRARFGDEWRVHPSTKVLVQSMRDELEALQQDRVWKEIEKVLEAKNSYLFFDTLFELGVLDVVFPSIYELTRIKEGTPYHKEGSVFIHTMMVLKELDDASLLLKLTALYHDIGKPFSYKTYGNAAGHEKIELVEPKIDMQIPVKLKKKMLFLIKHHIKIAKLQEMRVQKVASFFEEFRRDEELLDDLIKFCYADDRGRITNSEPLELEEEKLKTTLKKINSYSPKEWIESQSTKPSGEQIAQHIHCKNIEIVKRSYHRRVRPKSSR
ncbi:MAG: polynucleotide adenylyltransferase [Campylobacterales bacterium]